jgi:hypothetical protein
MPIRTEWIEPELALEHAGVSIYHTYKNDDYDRGRTTWWFTTDTGCGDDPDFYFDVRMLPAPESGPSLDDHPKYLAHNAARSVELGIPYSEWLVSQECKTLEAAWHEWNTVTKNQVIEATIRQAIDKGWLTQDGIMGTMPKKEV